jgi:mannose-6-phosphate isomerase-like protein (cupin superfamily)
VPVYKINLESKFGSLRPDRRRRGGDGEREIEVEGAETFVLGPQQGVTIPRGVMHRSRASKRTVIVMVEPATGQPTGD